VESVQTPLFTQGELAHSSMSVAQLFPLKPVTHVHSYASAASAHTPLFAHGVLAHSSMSTSQRPPSATAHWVVYADTTVEHIPFA
jgi:hypothetical protein